MDKSFLEVKENNIYKFGPELLSILLKDKTSGKNILWGTTDYCDKGAAYFSKEEIKLNQITCRNNKLIRPRVEKSQKEQIARIKNKAEVFTPSWMCNIQNNLVDTQWFGYKAKFNIELDSSWKTINDKVDFPLNKSWKDYVSLNRMEISCGEAPYITSRYDTVTGDFIPVKDRIGLLDRKFRIISENVDEEFAWFNYAIIALKSIYAYDWQGDNLLIARENILLTFVENYFNKFKIYPTNEQLLEVANIVVWNIWQMDGLKYVIPNSCKPVLKMQISLFDDDEYEECEGCKYGNNLRHSGIYCKIMDWERKKSIRVIDVFDGGTNGII